MDDGNTRILQDVHATSAGLKSYCTWYVASYPVLPCQLWQLTIPIRYTLGAIEVCRHACGGHGYSKYSGLSSIYSDFAVQCTWEGDNYVRGCVPSFAVCGV